MTQLQGKVNHFGKTDISNLQKNQRITNRLDPVFMCVNIMNGATLLANNAGERLYLVAPYPLTVMESQKSCRPES